MIFYNIFRHFSLIFDSMISHLRALKKLYKALKGAYKFLKAIFQDYVRGDLFRDMLDFVKVLLWLERIYFE